MIVKDIVMIGCGPSNLAAAVAIEEYSGNKHSGDVVILEKNGKVCWHPGMLLPGAKSQVSFLKDLVSQRNPRSRFSFLNFLHENGRLEDFINLSTFFPFRSEISDYLAWVAANLTKTAVNFNCTVTEVEPLLEVGEICGWQITTASGTVYRANRLIYGGGRDINVPEALQGLPDNRVIHSAHYLTTLSNAATKVPEAVAVIGGAQSSAEMYQHCLSTFPEARVTMLMRSIGLVNYESSQFTNTLFQNDYIDTFYAIAENDRSRVLEAMHTTNYSGVTPPTLQSLYQFHYLQGLSGKSRARMLTQCDILSATDQGEGVLLRWRERNTGNIRSEKYDLILLGTGYRNYRPEILDDICQKLDINDIKVSRKYRAIIPCKKGVSLHLQGVNENSHGIADSLLSVLAYRAQEIMDDIEHEE